MTTVLDAADAGNHPDRTAPAPRDRRGSPVPTGSMIATRLMELRKRRGLMIALIAVTVGVPSVYLAARLLLHAIAPKTYGPAGGYDIYTALTAGLLYVFGFIVAATLGATAGSADLTDGMFRHLVVTGRSRVALYLARIPAGLAIIVPLVAIGFTVVCVVCVFAAPTTLKINGIGVPAGLSESGLENWAADHATAVICDFPAKDLTVDLTCGGRVAIQERAQPGGAITQRQPGSRTPLTTASAAQLRVAARQVARQNWTEYKQQFRNPSNSLMVKTGLWIELEAVIGFLIGLGLGALLGQRSVAIVLMIVLEIVLTPLVLRVRIPHLENLQRSVIGVATAHLEPWQLPLAFGGGGRDFRLTESTATAVWVIMAWLIGWTALGAWRMTTRDA
jgi:hypothetical protein